MEKGSMSMLRTYRMHLLLYAFRLVALITMFVCFECFSSDGTTRELPESIKAATR